MPLVADSVTLQDVADALQQIGVSNLPAYASDINVMEHAMAYNEMLGILAGRGFLLAQIQIADQPPFWERKLTVHHVLARMTRIAKIPAEFLATFDVRDDLAKASLTLAGVWQPPQGTAGMAHVGRIEGMHIHGRHGEIGSREDEEEFFEDTLDSPEGGTFGDPF